MESELQLKDIIGIVKRRYPYFLVPFVVLACAALALSVLLPPVFQSSGLILIESPQISQSIVAGSIDSAARERIEVIKQRVMTRANLLAISEKFGVFSREDSGKFTSSEIVNEMRDLADVEFISSGPTRRTEVTIAFRVSFDHRHPQIAARVANELVTLFMNENVKTRTQIATETTEFLKQEAEKLERQLVEIEDKIASYKQKHSGALPENLNLQIEVRERLQRQIQDLDREIKGYEEELRFLDVQLRAAQVDASDVTSTQAIQRPKPKQEISIPEIEEYQKIQSALAEALATKAEKHPDVRALKRELEGEAAKIKSQGGLPALLLGVSETEDALLALNAADDASNESEKQALEAKLEKLKADVKLAVAALQPEDDYVQQVAKPDPMREFGIENIKTKMLVAQDRIRSIKEERFDLKNRLEEVEQSIILTPQVDRSLRGLERDYENAQSKYNEIRNKAMEAQIAENVEEASKSERFVLVEPPTVPDQPEKPNRLQLLAIGFAASIAAGAATLFGIEFIDGSVRGAENLANLVNMVPLAVIPYIETAAERSKAHRMRMTVMLIIFIVIVASVIGIHYFYMPLDRILYKLIDRFSL